MRKVQFVLKVCLGFCVVFAIGFPIGNLLQKSPLLGKIEQEQENLETSAKVTFVVESNNLPDNIPSEIHDCLPVNTNKDFQLLANLTDKDKQYFSVSYTSINGQGDRVSLIRLDNIGCLVIQPGESLSRSLYFYVDEDIANKITLKSIEHFIKRAGSKEKYEQALRESVITEEGGQEYLETFPEEMWAWKKLGVKYPSNIKIVKELTGFDY